MSRTTSAIRRDAEQNAETYELPKAVGQEGKAENAGGEVRRSRAYRQPGNREERCRTCGSDPVQSGNDDQRHKKLCQNPENDDIQHGGQRRGEQERRRRSCPPRARKNAERPLARIGDDKEADNFRARCSGSRQRIE